MPNTPIIKQPAVDPAQGGAAPAEQQPDPNATASATTEGISGHLVTSEPDNHQAAKLPDGTGVKLFESQHTSEKAEADLQEVVGLTREKDFKKTIAGGPQPQEESHSAATVDPELQAQIDRSLRGRGTV
jgi:hypothetical protein